WQANCDWNWKGRSNSRRWGGVGSAVTLGSLLEGGNLSPAFNFNPAVLAIARPAPGLGGPARPNVLLRGASTGNVNPERACRRTNEQLCGVLSPRRTQSDGVRRRSTCRQEDGHRTS